VYQPTIKFGYRVVHGTLKGMQLWYIRKTLRSLECKKLRRASTTPPSIPFFGISCVVHLLNLLGVLILLWTLLPLLLFIICLFEVVASMLECGILFVFKPLPTFGLFMNLVVHQGSHLYNQLSELKIQLKILMKFVPPPLCSCLSYVCLRLLYAYWSVTSCLLSSLCLVYALCMNLYCPPMFTSSKSNLKILVKFVRYFLITLGN
jgi:hypothetical protein